MKKERVLSGMRPTGKLHLGNLIGALNTWVELQEKYECFYMVADWHALTSEYANTSEIKENIYDILVDWLGAGIKPEKSVLFIQSDIKEHAELHLILSMITPLSWLERCPTYKEQMQEIKNVDLSMYGFLGYPVLQSADILVYKANKVPVGNDQLPHLEITREIARRFNNFYGKVFPQPEAILSDTPRFPGIDGRKMSKSYNNCIYLSDTEQEVKKKVQQMFTDPLKIHKSDLGHPEGCVVFAFHKVYLKNFLNLETECKNGSIGCVECKNNLTKTLNNFLEPFRINRENFLKNKSLLQDIILEGTKKAKELASKTIQEVRTAIKL